MTRILVVDDEPQIIRALRINLAARHYDVDTAPDGASALRAATHHHPDLVVLDLGLPDMDGLAVLGAIRARAPVPVVVLSARHDEAAKVAALDAGADDYVDKPFGVAELMARLRAGLRRAAAQAGATAVFSAGDLVVDTLAHRVTLRGEPVKLTPKEYDLLYVLARHAGRVVTHQQVLKTVWGPAHAEDAQYLRVFVGRLRRKIEAEPAEPRLLLTEPGVGYRLGLPDAG